jgi:hypothetical protein
LIEHFKKERELLAFSNIIAKELKIIESYPVAANAHAKPGHARSTLLARIQKQRFGCLILYIKSLDHADRSIDRFN